MKITTKTTLNDFLFQTNMFVVSEDIFKVLFERIEQKESSEWIKEYFNFNDLTLGQLVDIVNLKNEEDYIFGLSKVVMKLEREEILSKPAIDIFKFVLHAKKEIDRIINMWSSIKSEPADDEKRAGIENINHGWFGVADWFAIRMGITNHDEVFQTRWIRIFQCMKNDNEKREFNNRYREVLKNKNQQ